VSYATGLYCPGFAILDSGTSRRTTVMRLCASQAQPANISVTRRRSDRGGPRPSSQAGSSSKTQGPPRGTGVGLDKGSFHIRTVPIQVFG